MPRRGHPVRSKVADAYATPATLSGFFVEEKVLND
jgi:hypothetical protein